MKKIKSWFSDSLNVKTLLLISIAFAFIYWYYFNMQIPQNHLDILKKVNKETAIIVQETNCEVKNLPNDFFKNGSKTFHNPRSNTVYETFYILKENKGQYYLRSYTPEMGNLVMDAKVNVSEDNEKIYIDYCYGEYMHGERFEYLKKDDIFLLYNKEGKIFTHGKSVK